MVRFAGDWQPMYHKIRAGCGRCSFVVAQRGSVSYERRYIAHAGDRKTRASKSVWGWPVPNRNNLAAPRSLPTGLSFNTLPAAASAE